MKHKPLTRFWMEDSRTGDEKTDAFEGAGNLMGVGV